MTKATVKVTEYCIFVPFQGRIQAQGTYAELQEQNVDFLGMLTTKKDSNDAGAEETETFELEEHEVI
jgi:hypothetical protein